MFCKTRYLNKDNKNFYDKGFTIVELLVVIVVIGILAAITVVSYTGVTGKANAANIQSEMANAYKKMSIYFVENDQYPADINIAKSAKLIQSSAKTNEFYAVDNVSSPAYYCYMYSEGAETYAVDSLSGPSKGVCLTNLIVNGDFSKGMTGWTSGGGSITALGNVATITGSGSTSYPQFLQTCVGCAISGHSIYGAVKQRALSSNASEIGFMVQDSVSNKYIPEIDNPIANQWYVHSGMLKFTGSGNIAAKPYSLYADSATAAGKVMDIQYVLLFDLTKTFGSGNEPTKSQMDTIMSTFPNNWFNGTKKVNL